MYPTIIQHDPTFFLYIFYLPRSLVAFGVGGTAAAAEPTTSSSSSPFGGLAAPGVTGVATSSGLGVSKWEKIWSLI